MKNKIRLHYFPETMVFYRTHNSSLTTINIFIERLGCNYFIKIKA